MFRTINTRQIIFTFLILIINSIVELEFKLVYVGDAKEDKQDQVLDVVVIDAVAPGTYKFVFEVCLFYFEFRSESYLSFNRHHHLIQKNYQMIVMLMYQLFFFWLYIVIKNLHVQVIMYLLNMKIWNYEKIHQLKLILTKQDLF